MRISCHCVVLVAGLLAAGEALGAPPAERTVLGDLRAAYGPYVREDAFGFAAKVSAMRGGAYKFWRGSKDDFFVWVKGQRPGWFTDAGTFVLQHADVHLGNTGSYLTEARGGTLAYGLVDFDDSASVPAGIEALECLITLRELAADKFIVQTREQAAAVDGAFAGAYREGLTSGKTANELLRDDPWVSEAMKKGGKAKAYGKMVEKMTSGGKFVAVKAGEMEGAPPKEILVPMTGADDPTAGEVAAGLAGMLAEQPALRGLFSVRSAAGLQGAIKDMGRRVHLTSAGSQGQEKYLVLLDKSAGTLGSDFVIYLKREIPTAAERAVGVKPTAANPAERLVRDAWALTDPAVGDYGWARVHGEDFLVTLHEPWTEDGDPDVVGTEADLVHAARVLGACAGASHGRAGAAAREALAGCCAGERFEELRGLADGYAGRLKERFAAFVGDPAVTALAEEAREAVEAFARAHG